MLQGCRGRSLHWAFYHADVYCVINIHHQNIEVSISLNTSFFGFEKLLLTWISRFLMKRNHPGAYNHVDAFCVIFCRFSRKKSLGSVLFSRDFFGLTEMPQCWAAFFVMVIKILLQKNSLTGKTVSVPDIDNWKRKYSSRKLFHHKNEC